MGKKGVVRDPAVHQEVIEKVRDYAMSISMEPCHLSFSPIKGPEGNIEYLSSSEETSGRKPGIGQPSGVCGRGCFTGPRTAG